MSTVEKHAPARDIAPHTPRQKQSSLTGMQALAEVTPFENQALAAQEVHAKVDELEDLLMIHMPLVDLPTTHTFAGGVYAREMFAPAGSMVTGMIHKDECLAYCSQGGLWVYAPGRGGFQFIRGPAMFVSPAGSRRVGVVAENTRWTTFHYVGDERDMERIDEMLYEKESLERKAKSTAKMNEHTEGRKRIVEILAELHLDGQADTPRAITGAWEYEGGA